MLAHRVRRRSRQQVQAIGRESGNTDGRLRMATLAIAVVFFVILFRLFMLMVLEHDFYHKIAIGTHDVTAALFPTRGEMYIQDSRSGEEFPVAVNRDYFTVFADTTKIKDDEMAEKTAEALAGIFGYDDEKKLAVYLQLNKRTDPYEPLEQKVDEEKVTKIREQKLTGILSVRQPFRFYPEKNLVAPIVGFLGKKDDGTPVGHYGLEGYFDSELAGKAGYFEGMKSAKGRLISLGALKQEDPENGVDMLLTIDRGIQNYACKKLREGFDHYQAKSASLIIMDPMTGAIRAMCSLPDFDPNSYGKVDDSSVYNNEAIFTAYEPGSIFKPVVMAAAINEGLVTPNTVFHDPGSRTDLCKTPISNAEMKTYGDTDMTGVIDHSINTGMVFVAEKLGKNKFRDYAETFGFGIKTGISLDTEGSGTIDSFSKNKGDKVDCYAATASFGQGITVTPLQMATAFSAIANGGLLMRPYVVDEIRYPDGRKEKTKPQEIRRVVSTQTSALVSGMLVSSIDKGFAFGGKVPGYYVGGKTGTAQIAEKGIYINETNHSFIGFGPADNPRFVLMIKFEKPQAERFASYTASYVFGDIAGFLMKYYQIPPSR